jgi:hypothetical protein
MEIGIPGYRFIKSNKPTMTRSVAPNKLTSRLDLSVLVAEAFSDNAMNAGNRYRIMLGMGPMYRMSWTN